MSENIDRLHCPKCNSERKTEMCFKCGTATIVPSVLWKYPRIPDIEQIRQLAKDVGYAIAEHGSMERDVDLVAIPWTETAIENYKLIEHIAIGINATILELETKPLGRIAASIQLNGWYKTIDLSVVPIVR